MVSPIGPMAVPPAAGASRGTSGTRASSHPLPMDEASDVAIVTRIDWKPSVLCSNEHHPAIAGSVDFWQDRHDGNGAQFLV
jgi:hypothetical protein